MRGTSSSNHPSSHSIHAITAMNQKTPAAADCNHVTCRMWLAVATNANVWRRPCYHSLDVTLRDRPFFEPMTGSLGTTPSIHHQLDSAGDSSAPACCTLASAPNPDYTRNSPPPLSHCAASFCTVNSKAPGGHGGSNSRLPPPTPALSPLHQVDEFKDFAGPGIKAAALQQESKRASRDTPLYQHVRQGFESTKIREVHGCCTLQRL
jgi:hypothetical protein